MNYSWDLLPKAQHDDIVAKHQTANGEIAAYLGGLAQRRGKEMQAGQANNDPLSHLLRLALSKGLQFDATRAVVNTGGLLVGAVETTSHAAMNAIAGLLEAAGRFGADTRRLLERVMVVIPLSPPVGA